LIMEAKDPKEEIEALMIEAEQYRKRMESINRQMQMIESTIAELHSSMNALSALEENKTGTNILVSIGSGSFIKAQLAQTDRVIVGVGASISMEKSIPEARKYLEERLKQAEEAQEKMRKAALETTEAIQALDDEYQTIVSSMRQGQK